MLLELKDLYKNFGEKQVLKGISFSAEGGRAVGLLGRNGAGKTTTIRILMDVFPADSGSVTLDGKSLKSTGTRIGYLPEERGLYPKKKIGEQLIYFAQLNGMNAVDAAKSVDSWLERLGMSEYKNSRLDKLSKGNQQKIQLVTALAHNPQIIILDEPFSGLDPVNAMLLKDVVKEEIEKGKIVLFSSHQMNYIEEFCDSIAILNGGQIVLSGDLREIKHNYVRDKLVVSSQNAETICAELGACCTLREDGKLLVQLQSPAQKQEMIQRLASGYDVDEIKVFEPSLNDIFVEYASLQM